MYIQSQYTKLTVGLSHSQMPLWLHQVHIVPYINIPIMNVFQFRIIYLHVEFTCHQSNQGNAQIYKHPIYMKEV